MSSEGPSTDIPALSCLGISKAFPVDSEGLFWKVIFGMDTSAGEKIHALQGISLSVPKGEISGVLGRNGAGKSTLLRILGGVYTPSTGTVSISGDLSGLFELGGGGNRNLTGREYSKRALVFQQAPKKRIPELLNEIQDFSELGEYFDRPIYTFSTGMAARLYFSIATAIPHDVYLIDEVLSVGDEHFQGKCWRRMRDLLSNGASGLLVTHDWAAVIKLCKTAYIINRGKIVSSGAADATVARYLNFKLPDSKIASFSKSLGNQYFAETGKDLDLSIEIETLENTAIFFGYSIELLRLGIGWEILMMADPVFVTGENGKYFLKLHIPNLPIAAGEYSLNLFLTSSSKEILDVRSWTYGNSLKLSVKGALPSLAVAHLPLHWTFL